MLKGNEAVEIVKYYKSGNGEHWKRELGKGDWSADKLLFSLLDRNELKKLCGETAEIYLLTDGDKAVSFALSAPQDEVDAPDLSPWIGFVYTFPAYRGNRYAGRVIECICRDLAETGTEKVYVSTDEIGLYEKYGFTFFKTMTTREGKPTRVYVRFLRSGG